MRLAQNSNTTVDRFGGPITANSTALYIVGGPEHTDIYGMRMEFEPAELYSGETWTHLWYHTFPATCWDSIVEKLRTGEAVGLLGEEEVKRRS